MRESSVETYLHKQVEKAGGTTRKFKSPGRPNVPDRIVIWPEKQFSIRRGTQVHFVECKAPGKKPRPGQMREFARLWNLGCPVHLIDTLEIVDDYVKRHSK